MDGQSRSGQSQYSAANIDDCDAGQDDEDVDDQDDVDDADDVDDEDDEDDVGDEDDVDDEEEDCQDDVDDGNYLNILLQTPIPWQQKMLQQNRQFQVTLL